MSYDEGVPRNEKERQLLMFYEQITGRKLDPKERAVWLRGLREGMALEHVRCKRHRILSAPVPCPHCGDPLPSMEKLNREIAEVLAGR